MFSIKSVLRAESPTLEQKRIATWHKHIQLALVHNSTFHMSVKFLALWNQFSCSLGQEIWSWAIWIITWTCAVTPTWRFNFHNTCSKMLVWAKRVKTLGQLAFAVGQPVKISFLEWDESIWSFLHWEKWICFSPWWWAQPWWLALFLHVPYDAAFTGDDETLQRYVFRLLWLLWLHGECSDALNP